MVRPLDNQEPSKYLVNELIRLRLFYRRWDVLGREFHLLDLDHLGPMDELVSECKKKKKRLSQCEEINIPSYTSVEQTSAILTRGM